MDPSPADIPIMANPYNAERDGIDDLPKKRYATLSETKDKNKSDKNVERTMVTELEPNSPKWQVKILMFSN
ncbi:hypothetical protein LPTSP2_33070 [Leptospira ellinghausenii]|uniref:Uncharacterized protein n=1 Tax=Leptospira ellinghausenii TaxID=1917822 RepID=A0A2P2DH94_9LEPT|nr:hypothetical protein LPTSP2_33070 [Leptospira ellinghausenii]